MSRSDSLPHSIHPLLSQQPTSNSLDTAREKTKQAKPDCKPKPYYKDPSKATERTIDTGQNGNSTDLDDILWNLARNDNAGALVILHRNWTRSAVCCPASFEIVYIPLPTKGEIQVYITSVDRLPRKYFGRVRSALTVEPGESTRERHLTVGLDLSSSFDIPPPSIPVFEMRNTSGAGKEAA